MASAKPITGGPAFPRAGSEWTHEDGLVHDEGAVGMTLRDYLAAHAPTVPTWSFTPRMPTPRPEPDYEKALAGLPGSNLAEVEVWDKMREVARHAQWPWVWADHVLAARDSAQQ